MGVLAWLTPDQAKAPELARPTLDLSGPLLAAAFQSVARGSEELGGIERYIEALKLKSALFQDTLGAGKVRDLDLAGLDRKSVV